MKVLQNQNLPGSILNPDELATSQVWADVDSPTDVDAKIAAAIAAFKLTLVRQVWLFAGLLIGQVAATTTRFFTNSTSVNNSTAADFPYPLTTAQSIVAVKWNSVQNALISDAVLDILINGVAVAALSHTYAAGVTGIVAIAAGLPVAIPADAIVSIRCVNVNGGANSFFATCAVELAPTH